VADALCGDGVRENAEECDDGNTTPGDGCSSDCLNESGTCGDNKLDRLFQEQCEPLLPSLLPCGPNCRYILPLCGNGTMNAGESCDAGAANADTPGSLCRTDCSRKRCGDGILDPGELCDDGNLAPGDSCDRTCVPSHTADSTLPGTVVELPFRPGCASDRDCPLGTLCIGGQCSTGRCSSDQDCPAGERCLDGRCTSLSCRTDDDCPTGSFCIGGTCGQCRSDQDCPQDYRCINNRCLSATGRPLTDTGPETLAIMAAGAAAGFAWMRRRRMKA
jgi:cysteine-rich repeat protein